VLGMLNLVPDISPVGGSLFFVGIFSYTLPVIASACILTDAFSAEVVLIHILAHVTFPLKLVVALQNHAAV